MRAPTIVALALALALCGTGPDAAWGTRATPEEMEQVCENWLAYIAHHNGGWAGDSEPRISRAQDITAGGEVLARSYSIAPRGHVVVPTLKELAPIKVYSEEHDIDVAQQGGVPQLLRDVLRVRFDLFVDACGTLDAAPPDGERALFGRARRRQWERLLVDSERFAENLAAGVLAAPTGAGPLLETAWHQGAPYNDRCPDGDGGRCYVGCVATAAAQIMNYHEWPAFGVAAHTHKWAGDTSCGGSTPPKTLTANLWDAYDWANMPNTCDGGCSSAEEKALAELCYEVGVAFKMDYGACGSGAYEWDAMLALERLFCYDHVMSIDDRGWFMTPSHTRAEWYNMIKAQINADRPIMYSFQCTDPPPAWGHQIVCDGWQVAGADSQYHMNYGWADEYTGWYSLDDLEYSTDPQNESMIKNIKPASTTLVFSNESIQDAIDAADNWDIIELVGGDYKGEGNRDIRFRGKKIVLRSYFGAPGGCTIDCEGAARGFYFHCGEDSNAVLQSVTITNGYDSGNGGGIRCSLGSGASSPFIVNCLITENSCGQLGGGLSCSNPSSPRITGCTFTGNTATIDGGGISCRYRSCPIITRCLFRGNSADHGGGLFCHSESAEPWVQFCTFYDNSASVAGGGAHVFCTEGCQPLLENSIFASGNGGAGVSCTWESVPDLSCCDVYGNVGGDWWLYIADQLGQDGNICLPPLFCNAGSGDLRLRSDSPCAAYSPPNEDCDQIGARGVGCNAFGTFYVDASGTGDYPTVQDAVDAASPGDTVLLGIGTFTGIGNHDVDFQGKPVMVRSQNWDPASTVIDCGLAGRGFHFHSGESSEATLEGVTVTGGYAEGGGAILCEFSSPTIRNCVFSDNESETSGGALSLTYYDGTISNCSFSGNVGVLGGGVNCQESDATFTGCSFIDNAAESGGGMACSGFSGVLDGCTFAGNSAVQGGGLRSQSSSATVLYCEFHGNAADEGGALYGSDDASTLMNCTVAGNDAASGGGMNWVGGSFPVLERTIVAMNGGGQGIECGTGAAPMLICSDVCGNAGGDWVGCIADQAGMNGNFEEDPAFCDLGLGELGLHVDSPCLPWHTPCEELVGARGEGGCGPTAVEEALFRARATESGSVRVEWEIPLGEEFVELHVYRATSPDGPFARVSDNGIPPSSPGTFEDTTVWAETAFWYDLRACTADGGEVAVGGSLAPVVTGGRLVTRLYPPSPNPFSGSTAIRFDVPAHVGSVVLEVYDLVGRRVRTVVDGPAERGRWTAEWDGRDGDGRRVPSGVYFLRLDVGGRAVTRKIAVIR